MATGRALLSQLWFNKIPNKAAFSGITKLYKEAKKFDKNVKVKEVKDFLDSITSYLERKEHHDKKGISQRHMHVSGPGIQLQVDVMYLSKYKSRFKYALIALDAFSRKLYLRFLTSLKSTATAKQLEDIFKIQKFSVVVSDNGKEFLSDFATKVKSLKAEQRFTSTFSTYKTSKAERVIRTLRNLISMILDLKVEKDKIRAIKLAVDVYNNSYHRSIGMTPLEAEKEPQLALANILKNQRSDIIKANNFHPPKFEIGIWKIVFHLNLPIDVQVIWFTSKKKLETEEISLKVEILQFSNNCTKYIPSCARLLG